MFLDSPETRSIFSTRLGFHLFQLNSSRRLASVVIHDSGESMNLVGNSVCDPGDQLGVESVGLSAHKVNAGHSTEDAEVSIFTAVAHDTNSSASVEGGESLRHLVVNTGRPDLRDEDVIGLSDKLNTLGCYLTKDSDADTGTGEGVAHNELLVDAELAAELADLVLEELSQRLNQLETLAVHHTSGQTADVVVRLDCSRGSLPAQRLNQIRVKSSLKEPLDLSCIGSVLGLLLDADRLLLEQIDEGVANDLALGFRLGDACKAAKEKLCSVNDCEVNVKMVRKRLLDLFALVQAHQASVHKNGVEPVANGLLHETGCNRAIDTARDSTDDLSVLANKLADAFNLLLDKVLHLPVVASFADLGGKVAKNSHTTLGVGNFGVELNSKDGLLLVCDTSVGRARCAGNGDETLGEVNELIKVTHGDLGIGFYTLEEVVDVLLVALNLEDVDVRLTILALLALLNVLVVDAPSNLLASIADSKNWDTQVENSGINMGRNLIVDGRGTSAEHDTNGLPGQVSQLGGAGQHLSVDIERTQTSQDEMAGLTTKIEHQNGLL